MNIQYAAVSAWRQSKHAVQCSAILMRYRMHLTVSDVICMCYCSNVRRTYKTNTSSYITGNKLSSKQKGSYCNGQNDDCWIKAEDGRSRTAEAACTAHVPLHRGSYALATSCDCCQAPDNNHTWQYYVSDLLGQKTALQIPSLCRFSIKKCENKYAHLYTSYRLLYSALSWATHF